MTLFVFMLVQKSQAIRNTHWRHFTSRRLLPWLNPHVNKTVAYMFRVLYMLLMLWESAELWCVSAMQAWCKSHLRHFQFISSSKIALFSTFVVVLSGVFFVVFGTFVLFLNIQKHTYTYIYLACEALSDAAHANQIAVQYSIFVACFAYAVYVEMHRNAAYVNAE